MKVAKTASTLCFKNQTGPQEDYTHRHTQLHLIYN